MTVSLLDFNIFEKSLLQRFEELRKVSSQFYVVDVDKHLLWQTYLEAYPEEFRQQNNCNCCRQFIYNYGGLVVIDDNYKLLSIWD